MINITDFAYYQAHSGTTKIITHGEGTMNELNQSRLASTLTLLVGVWVAVSPAWIAMTAAAQMSTLIVGIVLIVASIIQYFVRSSWPSWVNGLAAAWLFLSIFLYGMSVEAAWSAVLAALAVVILALWDGIEIENYSQTHTHVTT